MSGSVYERKTAREGFYAFCRVPSLRAAPQWFPAHAVVYAKLFRGNGLRNAALVYIPCPISSFWLFGQSRSNVKYETPFYFYAYILYYTDKKIKPFYTYTSMERERIITRLCVYTFMTYNFFRHVQHIYIYDIITVYVYLIERNWRVRWQGRQWEPLKKRKLFLYLVGWARRCDRPRVILIAFMRCCRGVSL